MLLLEELFDTVSRFIEAGGDVLWFIAIALIFMWSLIIERLFYFSFTLSLSGDGKIGTATALAPQLVGRRWGWSPQARAVLARPFLQSMTALLEHLPS